MRLASKLGGGFAAALQVNGASANIRDSVFQSSTTGIVVQGVAGVAATVLIERCDLSYNTTGLAVNGVGGAATARIARLWGDFAKIKKNPPK